MKIVFCPRGTLPFHGRSLEEMPLTETENGILHLAEALCTLGHDVTVITDIPKPPETKPRYLHPSLGGEIGAVDRVIVVRDWRGIFLPFQTREFFFWTFDAPDYLSTFGLGDPRVLHRIKKALFVSEWQKQAFCSAAGIPLEKAGLLAQGTPVEKLPVQQERKRHRLAYVGSAEKGLSYLSLAYMTLLKKYPDLELHIFNVHPQEEAAGSPQRLILDLFKSIPHCYLHGAVTEKVLKDALLQTALFVYPCCVAEATCGPLLLAQAAGCPALTSTLGALPELVGEAGLCVEGLPGSAAFGDGMVQALDRLLGDDAFYQKLSAKALEQAEKANWKKRAESLVNL